MRRSPARRAPLFFFIFPVAVLVSILSGCATTPSMDWNAAKALSARLGSLSEEEWNADLDFLVSTLEKGHPDPWHAVEREAFIRALHGAADPTAGAAESAGATESADAAARAAARWTTVAKALALIGEGHTGLVTSIMDIERLPLAVGRVGAGFYVTAAAAEAKPLLGGQLVSVNGIPWTEVRARLRPYIGAESEQWVDQQISQPFAAMDVLRDAGIAKGTGPVRITVELSGAVVTADLTPQKGQIQLVGAVTSKGITPDESMARRGEEYWYRLLPEKNAVLVQYNACAERKDQTFESFCAEVFAAVQRERPARMILDLRWNSGGNSGLFTRSFLPRIKASSLNAPGGIIVLIGPAVFSSGIFAVAEMVKNTHALLVGEPTGQGSNHYGFTRYVMLPRSGLVFIHSSRLWTLIPGDISNEIRPDVPMSADPAEWFSGRDGVLARALDLKGE